MRQREQIEPGPHTVVCQKWEESERGWGTRPDGFSLHKNNDDREAFIQEYWDSLPDAYVPDIYEKPSGTPYLVDVARGVYKAILDSDNGTRYWNHQYYYPGDGGIDGWKDVSR